jgi:hypothetical protein
MQLTDDWDELYGHGRTAWDDDATSPATKDLVLQNVPAGASILEIGCGRRISSSNPVRRTRRGMVGRTFMNAVPCGRTPRCTMRAS